MQTNYTLPLSFIPHLHNCGPTKPVPALNWTDKAVQSAFLQYQGWDFAHSMVGLDPWPTVAVQNDTQALIRSIRRLIGKGEGKSSLRFAVYRVRWGADVVCWWTNNLQLGVLNNGVSFSLVDFSPPFPGWGGDVVKGVRGCGLDKTYVV